MIEELQIAQVPAITSAVIRLCVPRNQIHSVMGPAIREVLATVKSQGIGPAGPVFSHHFRINPEVFDFEVGVPISGELTPVGRVIETKSPAMKMVSTIYHGDYDGLAGAWGDFESAIGTKGYRVALGLWESYLTSPESSPNPADWRTELRKPLVD